MDGQQASTLYGQQQEARMLLLLLYVSHMWLVPGKKFPYLCRGTVMTSVGEIEYLLDPVAVVVDGVRTG